MGVLPIQLEGGVSLKSLNLIGNEIIDIDLNLPKIMQDRKKLVNITIFKGNENNKTLRCQGVLRVDTEKEFDYVEKGNILNFVLDELAAS